MCVDMVDVPGSKTIFFEQSFEHRNDVSGHQVFELETNFAKQNCLLVDYQGSPCGLLDTNGFLNTNEF
jgi:hypothetical protein